MDEITITKSRNASLDLLRIIGMLMIILLHSDSDGALTEALDASLGMQIYTRFLIVFSTIAVNLYVLISGYFLIKSKFRLQKLVALWLEVVFYSFTIKASLMVLGKIEFSVTSLASCFVPIFTGRYWFITIYFGMYLIAPFINILINAMNQKQHFTLNVILFVLVSGMVSIMPRFTGMKSGGGWSLPWFVVLYLYAAYFRLYPNSIRKRFYVIKILSWCLISLFIAVLIVLGEKYNQLVYTVSYNWCKYDSVPVVIGSLLLFTVFLGIEITGKAAAIISAIAKTTFGVFLIHYHSDCMSLLWPALNLTSKINSHFFPVIHICTIVCIFAICSLIDHIRIHTIGKIEKSSIVTKACDKVTDFIFSGLSKFIKSDS